jgi:hypothetical protein
MADQPVQSMNIPQEIIEAARKIALWADTNDMRYWQIMGVCDGRFAQEKEERESSLRFIATFGGGRIPSDCGTIHCNGSWCAEMARASLPEPRHEINPEWKALESSGKPYWESDSTGKINPFPANP